VGGSELIARMSNLYRSRVKVQRDRRIKVKATLTKSVGKDENEEGREILLQKEGRRAIVKLKTSQRKRNKLNSLEHKSWRSAQLKNSKKGFHVRGKQGRAELTGLAVASFWSCPWRREGKYPRCKASRKRTDAKPDEKASPCISRHALGEMRWIL